MVQEIDWNLLVALDVLLAEGSVTAAADRLNLSVPATSRTLGRIRKTFGDPILIRAGRGLVPTPRALALQERLHRLVEEAYALVESGRQADLAALERSFTIRANDAMVSRLAAGLAAAMTATAPGVSLRFLPEGEEDLAPLRQGIDLDIGVIGEFGPEVRVEYLFDERYVGLAAADHPLTSSGQITLARIAQAEHVGVSRRGGRHGAFDSLLAERGLSRRVVLTVPTFGTAAQLIVGSQLTGLITEGVARQVAQATGAKVYPIPLELPRARISQAWHVRHDLDPAHQWLRRQVSLLLRAP